jgi:5'-nucleotidase
MDNVIADFDKGFLTKWKKKYSEQICIELDDRKDFYIVNDYPKKLKNKIIRTYSDEGFILNLPIIPGAKDALTEMVGKDINVKICTSPLTNYKHCVLEKYQWVEKNLGKEWIRNLILTKDKTQIKAAFLIDDGPEIDGVFEPSWEHIIFDRPYNKDSTNKKD